MLDQALTSFFDNNPILSDQSSYAVAVSGGPDSMSLTHSLLLKYPDKNFHLLTVDHGLRVESAAEAKKVGEVFSKYKNAVHVVLKWEDDKPENAILEEARKARYELINGYCQSKDIQTVFVAHHQDDQAETFLIRLSKGSGLDGLAAMQVLVERGDVYLARPFLSISKEGLISYCKKHDIDYADDPTNENADFMRPRLRQSMTILEQEGLTAKRLSMTASRLERARDALYYYAKEEFLASLVEQTDDFTVLDFGQLSLVPPEISLRVLQNLIEAHREGYDYRVRMEKLEDLHHSLMSDPLNFKPRTLGGCLISLKDNHFRIEKEKK